MCNIEDEIDRLIREYDSTVMPLPALESEPHLLISKVRKHYMDYLIRMLSENYSKNQNRSSKNRLPGAIWRCAKILETKAAQTCMVVQLYRKNIVDEIKQLKDDTNNGVLNRKLSDCLKPSDNDKIVQTSDNLDDCTCGCVCNLHRKRRKTSLRVNVDAVDSSSAYNKIGEEISNKQTPEMATAPVESQKLEYNNIPNDIQNLDTNDELMKQLQNIFQSDGTDQDLFDGAFWDSSFENTTQTLQGVCDNSSKTQVIEQKPARAVSLDQRLASLSGILNNSDDKTVDNARSSRKVIAKKPTARNNRWLCEEYYHKSMLFGLLEEIGECDRDKLAQIKRKFVRMFGYDSDDEMGVLSPIEETPEFVMSCKVRISSWVVKVLTPRYTNGKIKGKALFKLLAKHLINIIYQCSHYPQEYEVTSFVKDFLQNHKVIRSEDDFKEFKIKNF